MGLPYMLCINKAWLRLSRVSLDSCSSARRSSNCVSRSAAADSTALSCCSN